MGKILKDDQRELDALNAQLADDSDLNEIAELNAQVSGGSDQDEIDALNAQLAGDPDQREIAELNAQMSGGSDQDELAELNAELGIVEEGKKENLGFWEREALNREARDGRKTGVGGAVLDMVDVFGIGERNEQRKEYVETRLAMGEEDNPLQMVKLAQSIGIDQAKIDEIMARADSGQRSAAGFAINPDVEVMKQGFAELAKPLMAARIKTREAAQQRLANAEEQSTAGEVASGGLNMAKTVAAYSNPLTMGMATGGNIVGRIGRMGADAYTLDENGNPVKVAEGDRSELAAVKAIAGGVAEQQIWASPLAGIVLKGAGKAIAKIPGVKKLAAGAAKGTLEAVDALAAKLSESEGGRLLLKTGEVLGKVDEKLHFGSLPNMIAKSRLTEFCDEVVGLGVGEGEDPGFRERFGEWLGKVTSVENNVDMLIGMIGVHFAMAGASALKARGEIKKFRGGREEVIAEYIGKDTVKRLSNEDLDMMYRLVTSDGLTVERVGEFLDKIKADKDAAKERMEAGESLEDVVAAWREGRLWTTRGGARESGLVNAGKLLEGELGRRAELTPEMEEALDAKVAEYSEGQEPIARKIKEDILARLKDNRVFDEGNEGMLDEMVAMSARRFDPESRRMKAHDLRGGGTSVAEKIGGIEELGVTSWQEAEDAGLTEKDRYGRYGGGARQALNIAIHGTEALKTAVKDGEVSGDLAEEMLTAARCELGARPPEERSALIDGILERAKGDEALVRRMIDLLAEESSVIRPENLAERLDEARDTAKAESIRERNPGLSEEDARSTASEPVETADGKMTTLGEVAKGEPKDLAQDRNGEGIRTLLGGPNPREYPESPTSGSSIPNNLPRVNGRAPQSALEGVENAERLKGTKLKAGEDGIMGCAAFPEVRVEVSAEGITAEGLTAEMMAKPENAADAAALLAQMARIAQKNGIKVRFSDEAAHTTAKALMAEVREQGLAKAQAKLDTRAKLFDLLMKTTLGNGVTYDEKSFAEALGKTSNGAKFRDGHGNIYGFVDGEGVLHFNPAAINFNTPIHEYGHLALEAMKKLDNGLWKRGMELVRKSKYFEEIKKYSETEGHEYSYLKGDEAGICDEALATLIGDRGERLVLDKGVGAELKAWLKAFWRKFKGTFGLADFTDEQMERMTVEEFVDAVNAELLRGSEFGVRRRPSGLSRREAAKLRERKKEEQHWRDMEEREEAEARRRWESSGMDLPEYILSRIEEGEAAFDLDWETMREIDHDVAEGKFAVGGIFTGSAADYANRSRQGGVDDGPSLRYVGSGEGTSDEGWGLYGANSKSDVLMRGYAGLVKGEFKPIRTADGTAKKMYFVGSEQYPRVKPVSARILPDGRDLSQLTKTEKEAAQAIEIAISKIGEKTLSGGMVLPETDNLRKTLGDNVDRVRKEAKLEVYNSSMPFDEAMEVMVKIDQADFSKWKARLPEDSVHEHIYEQTFFTNRDAGDETHLINLSRGLTAAQKRWILSQAKRENLDLSSIDMNGSAYEVLSGLAKITGSPRNASEFLVRSDIDGTVRGDDLKYYVSFRDDNIRVDHKWTDGVVKFAARRAPSHTGQEYTYAALTAKPDMPVVQVDAERAKQYGDHVSWKLADARKSILAAGGRLERGHYIIDMEGEPVEVGKRSILHGKHNRNNDFIYPVLGEVLKNAVRVNELGVREELHVKGKKDDQVNSKFVYLGAAAYGDEVLPVRIQIDRKAGLSQIGEIDVLKSFNTKRRDTPTEADSTGHRPPRSLADARAEAPTEADSQGPTPAHSLASISISNLIGVAQPLHPQIFSKDVAAALNKPYQGGEIGAKFAVGGRVAASNMGIKGAAEAEAMEKTGADREKIWRETGWWKGKDGKWRVELPDAKPSDGTVVNLRTRQFKDDNGHYFVFRLGELVDGGQLNSAYPGMVDEITLRFRHGMPSYKATYSPKDKAIELSDTYMQRANKYADETNVRMSNDATTLIVHELQHAIQQREVFASGADADKLSIEDYHNTSGEVEARNVQARLGMTAEQRAATPPWETEDVPESRQIVKFAAGRAVNRTPEETEAIRQEAKSKNDEANKTLDKLTALKQELDAAKEAGGDTAATAKKEYYQKINKQFGSDFAFDFGRPYGRLASYVPDRPLRLTMQVLLRKMKEEYRNHHPFTFDEAKDLAINVNDPAFFMRRDGATTGVRAFYEVGNGRIFCVSIKPNGEINEIETLYPKDIDRLATMLTSLKNAKKALLDLDATKAVAMLERQYNTAIIPELRDSLKSAISVLKDVAGVNGENLENSGAGDAAKLAAGGRGLDYGAIDLDVFVYDPGAKVKAMGEGETRPAGLAAAVEKREALRPWTKKQSPADLAKPIAFDAADMVMFWKAVSGAKVNPHVQKGERINGRRDAVGLNVGGDRIELVSRLFGVLDQGDIPKLHEECRADGFFRNEDPEWCAGRSKYAIEKERDRSQVEVDRRARELYELRVRSGEGGEHYSTQVLGHEIGHTLGMLPAGKNLGPVGNAARTLYDAMTGELKRQVGGTRKVGERAKTIKDEARRLIAWWHGQEEMPKYYEKDKEMFAEVFGIFLTQPESVQASAPTVYDACVKIIAGNERLAESYRRIAGLKWSGKSNDRVMAEVRKTWDREAQEQFRQLEKMSRESVSRKRDWFNYALNDRFGPMFAISQRGLKAERKALKEAVARGEMSEAEAADRLKAKEDEINALKTSLYNWQRQSGGQTRLMVAGFDEVRSAAERDGVSWSDVRDYAHNMRVIELGGRATAHGIDPARAAAILDEMKGKLGAAGYAKVEKTWKAFRAVYEREVLEDANVKEMFDEATNKMLFENKHYVTMKHRMGVEESAEWKAKIEEYRKGNRDAWDPCIDIQSRLHKGLGGGSGEERGFVLYHLEGSFEATEDPIAATIRRAIEIKESAARNHLVKQASETLRALGAKGVYDTALEGGAKPHAVNQQVYGKLTYMDGGVRHEVIVPKVVFKSFKGDSPSFGEFGKAMRFIRNTMTLWNPMFINRAYLMDRSSLETNLKGMHRAPIDVLSEALCIRGVGVPLYMVNNYLTRFTPICNTWLGKLLWNENTANHYAYRAQKIARICYEGRFGERLEEARRLREIGENGRAQEIEENVAVAKEMLRKNIFQSAYQFDKLQAGFDETAIMQQFGYRIEGGANPATWRGRAWEKAKAAGRRWSRFEEEQEAVTKIIAYLYEMKKAEREAGPGGKVDGDAVARTVIEQGGTPNLAARGVAATYLENATGFFWNVRKEGMLRTWRALKDHPTEWLTKNLVQTAIPAFLKGLMVTGGLEMLIRKLFDDDEEKIKRSWWAPAVIEHAQFTREAMKCVPGYYQRNYNVLPLAKFGDHVLSLRVKYSPEEFAIQNAIHTAMQKFGADPTDPDADWSTLAKGVYDEFLPNIFGSNYGLDWMGTIIGPLIGVNPYDSYRGRNIYDDATWKARWDAPGNMLQEMGKNFWNYSPFAPFVGTFKGQDRGPDDGDVPAWLDRALTWPVISRIPASMLTITSSDSYTKALGRVDERRRAYARLVARDVLAECIKNGKLGGLAEGLKDVPQDLKAIAVRHVVNGWRQYHMDPKAKELKRMRAIKDPELKAKARKWIEDSMLDD